MVVLDEKKGFWEANMAKRDKNRAAAARGTAADPHRAQGDGVRGRNDVKLKGAVTQDVADVVSERSGVAAFSFRSAFLIAGAVLMGSIVVPYLASLVGIPVRASATIATPPLLAAALASARYLIDTDRGVCRGFFVTFVVVFAVSLAVCWLLLYQGLLLF